MQTTAVLAVPQVPHAGKPWTGCSGIGPKQLDGERADREALDMVMTHPHQDRRGGIYDHLGGGFCRYSTDAQWMIPHFEKMLYDNGSLLALYADALAVGPDPLFEAAVRDTARWLEREMQHPDGGYFSAVDADSEGEEGKFYVWRRDQVKRLLTEEEYLVIETLYGLDKPANFEASGTFTDLTRGTRSHNA